MEFIKGYDAKVIGRPSEDLYCVICLNLIRNTVQLECGHGMCRSCYERLVKFSNARDIPIACPSCRTLTTPEKVLSVAMVDKIVLSVQVKCDNIYKGCTWKGELSELLKHDCHFGSIITEKPEQVPIPAIIPKRWSNGADIDGTSGNFYIIRPDLGVYLRSTNFNHGEDLVVYSLHRNCIGQHYLTTSGKFYIIQGEKYRRVTNLNTDKSSASYVLHQNCRGGDMYVCTGPYFAILFLSKNKCHLTTNMNKDEDGHDVPIPEALQDGLYQWAMKEKHYCLKQTDWKVEYHRYSSFNGRHEAGYSLNSTVLSFLPGGLTLLFGCTRGAWKCIYSEKNSTSISVSKTKMLKRKNGFHLSNTMLFFQPDLRIKLVGAQFLYDFTGNEAISDYLTNERWEESTEVEERNHVRLNPNDEFYVWQYVLEFEFLKDVFYTKFLEFTNYFERPPAF